MKNILIFGANSQISKGLIKIHQELGHKIFGIFHQKRENIYPMIKDISLDDALNFNENFDVIYLIGAFVPRGKYNEPNELFYTVNVQPFLELTQKFKEARFIMASTVAVYGSTLNYIDENTPINPSNLYADSKVKGELIISKMKSSLIIRFSSIYGKANNEDNFIDRCIQQALNNRQIVIYGQGLRKQNYIHVNDVIELLFLASQSQYNGYLLGTSDISVSNFEIAEYISNKTNATIHFQGEDPSTSSFYSNLLTKTILNFDPISFKEGIDRILES